MNKCLLISASVFSFKFKPFSEIAAPLDAAIDRGLSSVQKAGTKYLRDIGRDVASSLGEELKGVAKEKATSFVKEQFGLGFNTPFA